MEYSACYTGNVHDVSSPVDFLYCMPLGNALQILIEEHYQSFLFTIQCNTVALYCDGDGRFRIFDSHACNSYGFPHPQGTCVLLDVDDFTALINYFQSLYDQSRGLFELRGVCVSLKCLCNATEHSFNPPTHTSDQSKVIPKATDNDQQSNNSHVTNLNVNNMNGTLLTRLAVLFHFVFFFNY